MIDLQALERLARQFDLTLGRRGGRPEPGARRVTLRGRGLTFAGHREYQPGDDVRSIDWNVTARAGRPYVKVHEQELAGLVVLALDVSASMRDGPAGDAKRACALEAAALWACAAALRDERLAAVAFTDAVEARVPAGRGRRHAMGLMRALDAVAPRSRGTAFAGVARELDGVLRRPAVVVLISDFLDDEAISAVGRLARRHDVIGVCVGDAGERVLPRRRLARVEDVESGAVGWVDTSSARAREAFAARWRDLHQRRQQGFRRLGAPLVELDASGPWLRQLLGHEVVAPSAAAR